MIGKPREEDSWSAFLSGLRIHGKGLLASCGDGELGDSRHGLSALEHGETEGGVAILQLACLDHGRIANGGAWCEALPMDGG